MIYYVSPSISCASRDREACWRSGQHGDGNYIAAVPVPLYSGEQMWVDATHDHRGTLRFCSFQDVVSRQAISCADADADDISWKNSLWVESLDRFVDENGITDKIGRRGSRNHEKPSRRNDAVTQFRQRRTDQKNSLHTSSPGAYAAKSTIHALHFFGRGHGN